VVAVSAIVVVMLSPQGEVRYTSPALSDVLGYTPQAWAAQSAIAFIHPDDQQPFQYLLADAVNQPDISPTAQLRLCHRDGHWQKVQVTLNSTAPTSALGDIVATFQAIAESSPTHQWLRHYQLLSASTHDIVLFIHRDGRMLEVNDAAVQAYGYTREELLALRVQDLRSHTACAQVTKQISQLSMGGLLFETVHRRKDGTLFPVEVSSKGAVLDDETILLNIIRDISARKAAEDELRSLYQQLRELNTGLEQQVRERTAQLRRSLEFEARLKRITDKVRDSLDEEQIIQTAVRELALGLDTYSSDIGIYDLDQGISLICNEYRQSDIISAQGKIAHFADYDEIYTHLLLGRQLQFCWLSQTTDILQPAVQGYTICACPLIDDQGVLGDLWLYKTEGSFFDDAEVRLIQQVANQCAIAIRQARLYEAAQKQVQELERLNGLKDDFLNTVSHELRTPMSNIKMAAQMLESALIQSEDDCHIGSYPNEDMTTHPIRPYPLAYPSEAAPNSWYVSIWGHRFSSIDCLTDRSLASVATVASHPVVPTKPALLTKAEIVRYFQILHDECQREISLINNLLDLSRLDSGTEPLVLSTIAPHCWIPSVVEPFIVRTQAQQQQLIIQVPDTLPPMTTDLSILGRILTELLGNACKYTPPKESIIVSAELQPTLISPKPAISKTTTANLGLFQIRITNTGIEIPRQERDRVFDKFYRIPNNDPWKHGGTGLGLALVKKMIEHLGGTIQLTSHTNQTTFVIELPIYA
jgi:PAS domain S-box-containing protein